MSKQEVHCPLKTSHQRIYRISVRPITVALALWRLSKLTSKKIQKPYITGPLCGETIGAR